MSKTIYLTGQNNFGNRGCEALVRSTVQAVRTVWPDARFLVPSADVSRDAPQWPEAAQHGVEFVPVGKVPRLMSKWGGLCKRLPAVAAGPWPWLGAGSVDGQHIRRADLVLSIGGDNYSLDYGVASLAYFVGVAELAMSMGKPVALWGASVGPFAKSAAVERHMSKHLRKLAFVAVRESRSIDYLKGIRVIENVVPVVDTAFLMRPQAFETDVFWPRSSAQGVLGLNMSWLVEHVRKQAGQSADVVAETTTFIRTVIERTDLAVLLIPHVAPLDGNEVNSDDLMNARIADALPGEFSDRLSVVPPGLNAAQLKFVISKCRFLVAARTHATIAAFSTGVPTISIAYSVKAKGINRDLFGHEDFVLETPAVNASTLWESLSRLVRGEPEVRQHYAQNLDSWRKRALAGADRLRQIAA